MLRKVFPLIEALAGLAPCLSGHETNYQKGRFLGIPKAERTFDGKCCLFAMTLIP